MKIAVLSDNHGNVPALQTVIKHIESWQPDHVIFNGDVVNRGPKSLESWQIVKAKRQHDDWLMTRGNHEDYILRHEKVEPDPNHIGILGVINQNSRWTHQQLNGHCSDIATLPTSHMLVAPDGSNLIAAHASMRGNTDGIFPEYDDDTIRQQIVPLPAVFVTSHIHLAHIRQIGETILVNTGSAGQHCYGETRASYAQVVWQNGRWHAKIIRLDYDRSATERDFYQSGFLDETGPIAYLIFHEWKTGEPILNRYWKVHFMQAVLSGDISLENSVIKTLNQYGIDYH